MARTSQDVEMIIYEDALCGWHLPPDRKREDMFADVLVLFGDVPEEKRAILKSALPRIYESYASATIARFKAAAPAGKKSASKKPAPKKASTIVSRDLGKLSKATEGLADAWSQRAPETKTYIRAWLENEDGKTGEDFHADPNAFSETVALTLEHLIMISRDAKTLAKRSGGSVEERQMICELANWWDTVHGRMPTTDKGRGNRRHEPFLDICQAFARQLNGEFKAADKEARVNANLVSVAHEVLREMKTCCPAA